MVQSPTEPTFTRDDIDGIARHFASETHRWRAWRRCGDHDVARLPLTSDTGEPYCPSCCVVFSDSDSALTAPRAPADLPWLCDRCGDRYASEEVVGKAAEDRGGAVHLAVGRTVGGSVMPITCGPVHRRTTDGAANRFAARSRLS